MKEKITLKVYNLFLLCVLIFSTSNVLCSDTPTTIQTPKDSDVSAYLLDEVLQSDIDNMNNYYTTTYPNATLVASATRTYNCHAYAWHVSEGGNRVWINQPSQFTYWTDGSYGEVATEAEATKVSYASGDHSAITTTQAGWFVSKWGRAPLMEHAWNDCPYDDSQLKYYAISLNVIHAATAPTTTNNYVVAVKNWIGPAMVPDATVTLTKDGQVVDSKITATSYPDRGTAKFSYALTPGTMTINVTKSKYFPYEGPCELVDRIGELWVSLHGGVTSPYDEWYEDTYCFNAIVNLEYHFALRWAVVMEVAYNDFRWERNQRFQWWNFSGTMRHYYPIANIAKFKPFINIGPGFYIPDEGDNRFGAKIGTGVDYPITDRINIEIGTDYHYIFEGNKEYLNQNKKTSFQHFHTGITYKLR